ncbi:hypothetical protein Fcan01_11703 [Folsomia candida]|uniref:Uncharacterized protein n=1 Tax=Folsomia candida TaxID=158441 RepID=A0A226EBJ4_FOLCA|nr:hypothetical protein Fcan01_11703 [Folsomia candida]
MGTSYVLFILQFCFLSCKPQVTPWIKIIPVFDILLENLGPCNIQIVHDEHNNHIDWFNLNQPARIKLYPGKNYENSSPVDIFQSRAQLDCKLIIFLCHHLLEPRHIKISGECKLIYWQYMAERGSIFHTAEGPKHSPFDGNAVMALVSTLNKINPGDFGLRTRSKAGIVFISPDNKYSVCTWYPLRWDDSKLKVVRERSNGMLWGTKTFQRNVSVYEIIRNIARPVLPWCYYEAHKIDLGKELRNPFDSEESNNMNLDYILPIVFVAAKENFTRSVMYW